MDCLSLELLQSIFCLLSQRQKAICLSVCRSWYLAARAPLYRSIEFYTLRQLSLFLKHNDDNDDDNDTTTSTTTITSMIWEVIPKGHLVQAITLHINVSDNKTFLQLQQQCPYVTYVDAVSENDKRSYGVCCYRRRFSLTPWRRLTHLPVWHVDTLEKWQTIQCQLLHLGIDFYLYDHLIHSVGDDGTGTDNDSIYLSSSPSLSHKILRLPMLPNLQQLDLYASRSFFQLDRRCLNIIHAACPLLRSLALTAFHLDICFAPQQEQVEEQEVVSATLTTLRLFHVVFNTLSCYDYFGGTYTGLTHLHLLEPRIGNGENTEQHRAAIFDLITHYRHLKYLGADLHESLDHHLHPRTDHLWPYQQLHRWFKQKKQIPFEYHWSTEFPRHRHHHRQIHDPNDGNNRNPSHGVSEVDDHGKSRPMSPASISLPSPSSSTCEFHQLYSLAFLTSLTLTSTSRAARTRLENTWATVPVLPLLTTLTIKHTPTYSGDDDDNDDNGDGGGGGGCSGEGGWFGRSSLNIYHILDVCPRLLRCHLSGGFVVNKTHRTVPRSYILQQLELSDALVWLGDVADISQHCPRLNILRLDHLRCELPCRKTMSRKSGPLFVPLKEEEEDDGYQCQLHLDLSSVALDYLALTNLFYVCRRSNQHRFTRRVAVDSIQVKERSDAKLTITTTRGHFQSLPGTSSQVAITVHCLYADRLDIYQNKPFL